MRAAVAIALAASMSALACGADRDRPCPAWEVLDRVAPEGGQSAYANAFVVDGRGHWFYDVFFDPGYWPWVVRRSDDAGRTWTTAERFQVLPNHFNYPLGMTVDADGRVFVAGVVATDADTRGMIRTTVDAGRTWTVSDYYLHPGSVDCKIYQVRRIDRALFAMGRCATGTTTHWLVRRSLDSGRTWSTVDFPHDGRAWFSKAFDVAKARDGGLLMLGIVDSETGNRLLVRRSADAGSTWTDAWTGQTEPGADDVVGSITVTSRGSALITEWVIDKNRHGRGVIRRSTDNGASWAIADTYRHDNDLTLYAGLTEDRWGRLHALATTAETAVKQGVLRQSLDDGATWTDVAGVHGENGQSAGFSGIFTMDGSELIVTGQQGASPPFSGVLMRLPLVAPGVGCRAS